MFESCRGSGTAGSKERSTEGPASKKPEKLEKLES